MVSAKWTSPEITRLRREWPVKTASQIITSFPRHPWGSINSTAHHLGLKKLHPRGSNKWRDIAARHVPTFQFGATQETV